MSIVEPSLIEVSDPDLITRSRPGLQRPGLERPALSWLGVMPFLLYSLLFLILPAMAVLVGAFKDSSGHWTSANIRALSSQQFLNAYETSIKLSLLTAVIGGLAGTVLCYAALHPRAPRIARPVLSAFSSIAAQFGGVPLAFMFIASVGTLGVVTKLFRDSLGFDLYEHGFTVFGFWGIVAAYTYFQIPLMVLIIAPALDGLRAEWREAATSLGASSFTYWRRVGAPVLAPSILSALILLFGNAFSAQATAYALNAGFNIVPLQITAVVNGNVQDDPHMGHALALGMIVVIAVTLALYLPLARRAARWRA